MRRRRAAPLHGGRANEVRPRPRRHRCPPRAIRISSPKPWIRRPASHVRPPRVRPRRANACIVLERIPSCDVNLVEQVGRCVRPALCGRAGQAPCTVSVRGFLGCDFNLVERVGQCQRAGSPDASSVERAVRRTVRRRRLRRQRHRHGVRPRHRRQKPHHRGDRKAPPPPPPPRHGDGEDSPAATASDGEDTTTTTSSAQPPKGSPPPRPPPSLGSASERDAR